MILEGKTGPRALLLKSVTEWMVSMASKEHFGEAVSADSNEIDRLNDFLFNRPVTERNFKKIPPRIDLQGKQGKARCSPFHFLRTDISVLLGPSGTKLLSRTWCKYYLKPTDSEPARLRPALVKLFSVAARIAATKGVGQALQRLVADFERLYFPVVVDPEAERERKVARRFALLSVLQEGQGSHLLHRVLGGPEKPGDDTFPSRHVQAQPDQARRLFLFEAAYRARSWSDAYRHGRLSKSHRPTVQQKLREIRTELFQDRSAPVSKKKQILIDFADSSEVGEEQRLEYARRACSYPAKVCRPGQLEETLCSLTSPGDPWWRTSLTSLYRHRPVPHRWMSDLRKLWQNEPSLRPTCKVLFNLIRYSRPRAQATLDKYGLDRPGRQLDRQQVRALVTKVKKATSRWLEIAPPCPEHANQAGAVVKLSSELWAFVTEVCCKLESEAPVYCRANFQRAPALVMGRGARRFFSFSPEFLTASKPEQKVLLARALFRETTGLEQLQLRAADLYHPNQAVERALEYAEWSGHPLQFLEEVSPEELDLERAIVCLEEMYWTTQDQHYQRLAAQVYRQCWCPLFDREADLFACSYADLVTASHALLQADLGACELTSEAQRSGLNSLGSARCVPPSLCLRLQSLWMTRIEELQGESTR